MIFPSTINHCKQWRELSQRNCKRGKKEKIWKFKKNAKWTMKLLPLQFFSLLPHSSPFLSLPLTISLPLSLSLSLVRLYSFSHSLSYKKYFTFPAVTFSFHNFSLWNIFVCVLIPSSVFYSSILLSISIRTRSQQIAIFF